MNRDKQIVVSMRETTRERRQKREREREREKEMDTGRVRNIDR